MRCCTMGITTVAPLCYPHADYLIYAISVLAGCVLVGEP